LEQLLIVQRYIGEVEANTMGEFEKRLRATSDNDKTIVFGLWTRLAKGEKPTLIQILDMIAEARREFPCINYNSDASDEYLKRLSKWLEKWFGSEN
jgi:hypothetical protein